MVRPPAAPAGDVWHALVVGLPPSGVLYGYKIGGKGGWETPHRWDPSKVRGRGLGGVRVVCV